MFTRPGSPKVAHLGSRPYVSCSYWDPAQDVAVAECAAEVADDEGTRRAVWELFASADEPLGFDPRIMGGEDHLDPKITVLRLTPWRINLAGWSWRAAT